MTGAQGTSAANGLRIENNVAYGKRPGAGGNAFYTDGAPATSPSRATPPTATRSAPSISARRPATAIPALLRRAQRGQRPALRLRDRRLPPTATSLRPELLVRGADADRDRAQQRHLRGDRGPQALSPEGFFDVCPYSDQGVSYPTNLTYSGDVVYPAEP